MRKIVLVVLCAVLIILGALLLARWKSQSEADRKIVEVEKYLDEVSAPLCDTLSKWQKSGNFPTWCCGPTSWWMCNELKRRFFPDLPIRADRDTGDCILFRAAGSRSGGRELMDHCWVEVYYKGYMLWIDPTYAQFDNNPKVLFAWFHESQWLAIERFKNELKATYNLPSKWNFEVSQAHWMVNRNKVTVEWKNWALWLSKKAEI